jgi:hypothetical protein
MIRFPSHRAETLYHRFHACFLLRYARPSQRCNVLSHFSTLQRQFPVAEVCRCVRILHAPSQFGGVRIVNIKILCRDLKARQVCNRAGVLRRNVQKFVRIILDLRYLTLRRDRSVGIALGYRLDDRGSRVQFPAEAGNFSLYHRVQNGSGALPGSSPIGYQGLFPWW